MLEGRRGERRRRTFDGLADQFLPGKFEPPAFSLRLAHKDVTLATALGREHKVPMRLANITLETYIQGTTRNVSSSCVACHGNAGMTTGRPSDFTYLLERAR